MKLGDIGEEMVATAIAIAKERGAAVEAITVVRCRAFPLQGALPPGVAERARCRSRRRGALGEENGVEVLTEIVMARSIGHAIVEEAQRRTSTDRARLFTALEAPVTFFSPTVDHVLQSAHCEVLVVAFPEGVFEDEVKPEHCVAV